MAAFKFVNCPAVPVIVIPLISVPLICPPVISLQLIAPATSSVPPRFVDPETPKLPLTVRLSVVKSSKTISPLTSR